MSITVDLQDMYSYSFAMIVIAGILVVGLLIFALVMRMKRKRKKRKIKNPVSKTEMSVAKMAQPDIKQKYFGQLYFLEKNCRNNEISNRMAYQELSKIIRYFVYEITGIKVHNYTLQEIAAVQLPSDIYSLIRECYEPEFAIDGNGDICGSITKARKVIAEWN